jgi:hypothetical protein
MVGMKGSELDQLMKIAAKVGREAVDADRRKREERIEIAAKVAREAVAASIKDHDNDLRDWLEYHQSRGVKTGYKLSAYSDSGQIEIYAGDEVRIVEADRWPRLYKVREFFHIVDQEPLPFVRRGRSKSTVVESNDAAYTGKAPPSSPADTSAEGMRDDFNTQVKQAKAETLARVKPRPSTHQLATYRALVRNVDLLNPELPEDERKRRAKRLVQAYERLRARRPTFHDHNNKQLLAAFSIMNKVKYHRSQARKAAKKAALAM